MSLGLLSCISCLSALMFIYTLYTDKNTKLIAMTSGVSILLFGLTALLNPGIVSKSKKPDNLVELEDGNFCEHCNIVKSRSITHCIACNVCIIN